MPKVYSSTVNVFEAARQRLRDHYLAGDRVVISISGGKDSTVVMELAVQVARELGKLPVECLTRDEEIMVPGTFEYLERVYERPEVDLHWVIAGQAIINAFDRWQPYWWVFDPAAEDRWVRQPPPWAQWIETKCIEGMCNTTDFPPEEGKRLISVTGLRAAESLRRMNRIASTQGALTKHPTDYGAYVLAPIYDWKDDDVWKAIHDFGWDYNAAYDTLFRLGVAKNRLRIAPPTMQQGLETLRYLMKGWPLWFDQVNERCPGVRTAARFGRRVLKPLLQPNEDWQGCMQRLMRESEERGCAWMLARQQKAVEAQLSGHAHHSSAPLPMTSNKGCMQCLPGKPGSWERLAETLYNGDPWAIRNKCLEPLEPYVLREGMPGWYEDGKKGSLHW